MHVAPKKIHDCEAQRSRFTTAPQAVLPPSPVSLVTLGILTLPASTLFSFHHLVCSPSISGP